MGFEVYFCYNAIIILLSWNPILYGMCTKLAILNIFGDKSNVDTKIKICVLFKYFKILSKTNYFFNKLPKVNIVFVTYNEHLVSKSYL